MIFIFNGFNRAALTEKLTGNRVISKLYNFVKTNRIKCKCAGLAMLGVGCLTMSLLCAGVTVGFNVSYSGKDIAVVGSRSVLQNAISIATENITDTKAQKAIASPEFSLTLTVSDRLENAAQLADSIIENTDCIGRAAVLKVNGETVACADAQSIKSYLEQRRTAFYVDGAENSAEFVDTVEVEEGYYLKSEISEVSEAKSVIDTLNVKTVSVIKTEVAIPYNTVKKTTSEKTVGYSEVVTAGCNGLSRVTESVEYINGEEAARTELSNEVVTAATDKVVLVGTAIKKVSASERATASSAGLICPLASYRISSYYGDGRNHKGIDLCASRGTAIFAAGGGTVTYAGYDCDFGYNVIIQHSNGIKTRYAHADALCVSKGQVVSQGDMIATVGSTGQSTGNHLHFEVIVNGVRVNPAPYIGL